LGADHFVNDEAMPESGIAGATFWSALAQLLREFGPRIASVRKFVFSMI